MAQQYKTCPICGTRAHGAALICPTCGTSLKDVEAAREDTRPIRPIRARYERQHGETDLSENDLPRPARAYLWITSIALIAVAFLGGLLLGGLTLAGRNPLIPTPQPSLSGLQATALPLATNTPRPTILMMTVTPAPPTPLPTPTEGPCIVQVQPGDDLISLAWRCGHRDLFVLTEVLEINNLAAPELIAAGQTLQIPRPTPTPDPNAAASVPNAAVNVDAVALFAAADPTQRPSPTIRPSPTLLPGVAWHEVLPNQSMIEIVFTYNTEAEVLQQLNPELDFLQCDFQFATGGERCTVSLIAGQRIRVPVPLPTATLSPTPSGSETPTPSATPTFNVPNPIGPPDRTFFTRDELVTLRWVASGTLGANEVYRLSVFDMTAGVIYTGETTELYYIIPQSWQPADADRHDYEWTVSVIALDQPNAPLFTTPVRAFSWQGRGSDE